MRDGHGCIAAAAFVHEQQRHRLADDHAAAEHDDICARCLDAALDQQPLAAERRAGDECIRIAERELRDVDGMESVHVLSRVERLDDRALINVLRRRRLHEDAVDRGVVVQGAHDIEELRLRGVVRQRVLHAVHPEFRGGLFLAAHIRVRRRIVADHDNREPRLHAASGERGDRGAGLFVDALCDGFSVNQSHAETSGGRSGRWQ